jgi:fimbrial chaperone protein
MFRLGVLLSLGAIAVGFPFTPPAFAFKISPFDSQMAPSGPRAKLDYLLENDSSDPTAVQISIVGREQAANGGESLPDAGDQFLVFPAQLILLPNEKRTVRVQWLGSVKPAKELAFRLVAEQLPVDLRRPGAARNNLQILVRYETALYVLPPGVHTNPARDLLVQRAESGRNRLGQPTMDVTIVNNGPEHIQLQNAVLSVRSADGKTATLSSQRLTGSVLGENILAGSVRRFRLPWPRELAVGPVSATLEVKGAP